MQLADPRFADFQYRANLFEVELFPGNTALTPVAAPGSDSIASITAVAGRPPAVGCNGLLLLMFFSQQLDANAMLFPPLNVREKVWLLLVSSNI